MGTYTQSDIADFIECTVYLVRATNPLLIDGAKYIANPII